MLSHKWTFSLQILVVLLVLALVVPHAFAGDFKTELSIEDVSFADKSFPGGQDHDIQSEFDRNTRVYVKFDKVVDYRAVPPVGGQTVPNFDEFKDTGVFTHHDVVVLIYNEIGQVFATRTGAGSVVIEPRDRNRHDGKNYTITFNTLINTTETPRIEDHNRVLVYIKQGSVTAVDPAIAEADSKNAEGSVAFDLVYSDGQRVASDGLLYPNLNSNTEPEVNNPAVYGISTTALRARAGVTEPFEVKIRLSELPRAFTTDHIDVTNGKASELFPLGFLDIFRESGADRDSSIGYRPPTGGLLNIGGHLYYEYLVTIEPNFENKNDIVIKVKTFEDLVKPFPYKYEPPTSENEYVEGFDKLTVKVGKEDLKAKAAGTEVVLAKDEFIPANGYFVITKNTDASEIIKPDAPDGVGNEPKAHQRNEGERLYNIQQRDTIPNLETFLSNGGVIDVKSPVPLIITEVMWGSDASLGGSPGNAQWIELHNPGGQHKIAENTISLIFYTHGERPPARNADGTLPSGIVDRIGTLNDAGSGLWTLAGKGQSGRTGHGEDQADVLTAAIPYTNIVSMFRLKEGTEWAGGQMAASWMASTPPNDNFDPAQPGHRTGSPGAATDMSGLEAAAAAAAKAKVDAEAKAKVDAEAKAAATGTVPQAGSIYISEVMFAGGGSLPQWIEIANGSRTEEINLSGWTLTIDNAAGDADVSVGGSIVFTIPVGTMIGTYGQNDKPSTIVIVTEMGRTNLTGEMASGQILDLWTDGQTELILAGVTKRRYSLLSSDAFLITLAPPAPTATKLSATATPAEKAAAKAADLTASRAHAAATDMAGNLGADGAAAWALPMSDEGIRSSILRTHVQVNIGPSEPNNGTMMDGWVLAANTAFAQPTHVRTQSYYGAANDVGTPGFRAGGALPVQLSHFRPARQKETGQVVITWATQSELNNAGFFIKRSQQRDGQFQVINAAMIQGAGTTSEKQFYAYTDTTAQPNVVYYYQIEDVSLDGNHQTLTNGIRLKGHIGAAGKLTTTWGDLKTSNQ